MLFYESGGRAYAVLQLSNELVPKTGFHLPGEMGGVWFGPMRTLSSIRIDGFGKPLSVSYENSGRKVRFERGELEILIPEMEESFYLRSLGCGKLILRTDGTPIWLSERRGWKREEPIWNGSTFELEKFGKRIHISSTGDFRILDGEVHIDLKGKTSVCISFERCDPKRFDVKKEEKERSLLKVFPHGRNTLESSLKIFLKEMYLRTDWGYGIMAGLEDYPWWFTIDTSFLAPILLKIGLKEILRDSLENISNHTDRFPPHEIVNNGVVNETMNEVELFSFLHSILTYSLETGDDSLLEEEFFNPAEDLLKNGFPRGRGMVELEGEGDLALDVSCWAFSFLRLYSKAMKLGMIGERKTFEKSLEFFEKNFLKFWYDEKRGLFRDFSRNVHFTQILPLYFELVPDDIGSRVLRTLRDIGMITPMGLRHSLIDTHEDGFYGLKTSKVWWLANALLMGSVKKYGSLDVSNLIALFEKDVGEFKTPPEIVGNEGGCFAQSWSAMFYFS